MTKILGYGEDALTLWLLKNQPTEILKLFNDKTEVETVEFQADRKIVDIEIECNIS